MNNLQKIPEVFLELLEHDEIDFMTKLWYEVGRRDLKDPVVYAGSGGDIEHAIFLGRNLVFFDNHLPEDNFREILSKIERIGVVESTLFKGNKMMAEFQIADMKFRLSFYGEDATKIGSIDFPELKNGISVYFVKDPYPRAGRAGSIRNPKCFARALKMIKLGGYYIEKECPITCSIPPEKIGFKKIMSGKISSLSFRKSPGNLYVKLRDVENLEELLEKDFAFCLEKDDFVRDLKE
jgi:hypothetical protein